MDLRAEKDGGYFFNHIAMQTPPHPAAATIGATTVSH